MTPESKARGEEPPPSIVTRVLAGLALAACMLAIVVVIAETIGSGDDDEPAQEQARQRKGEKPPKDYVVVEGETATSIARKFGVPLGRIERLNPEVDLQVLNAGEALKLR